MRKLTKSYAYDAEWRVDVKRRLILNQEFTDTDAMSGFDYLRQSILVGIKNQRLRLRYPDASHSKVQYVDDASDDLKALAALFICKLVPVGVFADKLEEDTKHSEAADLMRQWQSVYEQQEIKQ